MVLFFTLTSGAYDIKKTSWEVGGNFFVLLFLNTILQTNLYCFFSLLRYLLGVTEEERKKRREEILSTR